MKLLRKPVNSILCFGVFVCSVILCTPNHFSQTPATNNAGSIAGRVTFGGKGVAEVTVVASSATTFDGRSIGQAKTDLEGNYRINSLPAGSFKIVPLAQPYVMVRAEGP